MRTGWTQEQIAAKEGKTQRWVSYRLTFGRFLAFSADRTTVLNITERGFRKFWEATDKSEPNETIRFRAVLRAMALAMIYPEPERGGDRRSAKAKSSSEPKPDFSKARLSQARAVLRHSRALIAVQPC